MKRLMILILHLLTVSMCVYQRPTFKVILVTNLLYVEVNMLPNLKRAAALTLEKDAPSGEVDLGSSR